MPRNAGFIVPLVSIFVIIFVLMPIAYWYMLVKPNITGSVKGVSNISTVGDQVPAVNVQSLQGTWDLFVYTCSTKEECLVSLTSGKKVTSVSGGKTESQSATVNNTQDWPKDNIVKVFVKNGWGSASRLFSLTVLNNSQSDFVTKISQDGKTYSILLVPGNSLDQLKNFIFSDK